MRYIPSPYSDYGRVESKKQTIFGYKLHLLVTASGVIVDFEGPKGDLAVGYFLIICGRKDRVFITPFRPCVVKEDIAELA